jgi:hypothetical protein
LNFRYLGVERNGGIKNERKQRVSETKLVVCSEIWKGEGMTRDTKRSMCMVSIEYRTTK